MDTSRLLDFSREARHLDESGTPTALIELAHRANDLVVVQDIDPGDVLVEFPLGAIWRRQTGCARFVQLRAPREGRRYALVCADRRELDG